MTADDFSLIKQILEELLARMDFSGQITFDIDDTDEQQLAHFNIQSEEAPYLIGRGGDNLKALQEIARAIVNKRLGYMARFSLDINNYQQNRLSLLKEMAQNLAREAQERVEPRWLPPMNAYERRAVHLALKEFEGISTESEGMGAERRVVIKPKK